MQAGDHLVSPRIGYTHHGIYIGNDQVIHYGGYSKSKRHGVVLMTSLKVFCQGNGCQVKDHPKRKYTHEETVQRAYERLGEDWYNAIVNNCEHFVSWCINGLHSSRQVNQIILAIIGVKAMVASASKKSTEKVVSQALTKTVIQSGLISPALQVSRLAAFCGNAGVTAGVLAGGLSASALAPIAAGVALGCLVDYGLRQLFKG